MRAMDKIWTESTYFFAYVSAIAHGNFESGGKQAK